MQEKALQKLDQRRIADITALDTTTRAILIASSTIALGTPNTVYISLPSATSTCADLELPSLPDGWSYHCAGVAELSKTDGTGWLPIDFRDFHALADSGHTNILENVGMLPIDPVSNAGTLNYYAFVTGTSSPSVATSSTGHSDILKNVGMSGNGEGQGQEYVLTAVLDSKKYLKDVAQADQGTDPIRLELGSDLKLWSNTLGMLMSWQFDNADNNYVHDNISQSTTLFIKENMLVSDSQEGAAVKFAGNDFYSIGNFATSSARNITIQVDVYPTITPLNGGIVQKGYSGNAAFNFGISIRGDRFSFGVKTKSGEISVQSTPIKPNHWYRVTGIIDARAHELFIYVNGELQSKKPLIGSIDYSYSPNVEIGRDGSNFFQGLIDNVMIYNHALNESEIAK